MATRRLGLGRAGQGNAAGGRPGRRWSWLAAVGVLLSGLSGVAGPGAARADGGAFDPSFGEAGGVVVDWTGPADTTLLGTNGVVVGAAVGDRFGITAVDPTTNPLGNGSGRSAIGFNGPAVARGMTDDGLIVGSAGDDFGLVHFEGAGRADFRFGTHGHATVDFGGPAVAYGAVRTWDNYGWVVVGSARPGSSRKVALARLYEGGVLNPGFGTGGTVTLDLGPGDDEARAVVTDYGHSLIVAGRAGGAAMVARFRPDGSLDPTFGTDGVVRLDLTAGDDVAHAIAFDVNGYFEVAGRAGPRGFVSRITWDGVLDTAYGTGGTAFVDFGGETSEVRALRGVAGDNSTVVVAGVSTGPAGRDAAVARLTPSGALDPSFGHGGMAVADFGGAADDANGLHLTYGSNAVTAVGGDGRHGVVWRLTAAGQPDTAAGPRGLRTVALGGPSNDRGNAVAVTADQRVVMAGTADDAPALARLSPDGTPDETFGRDGKVISDFGTAFPHAVAVAPDGGIVVWGQRQCSITGGGCAFLARYRADGRLDTGFAGNGAVEVYIQPGGPHSLLVQPDGAIVTTGKGGGGSWVARWRPDGRPDSTFGTAGAVQTSDARAGVGVVRHSDGSYLVVSADSTWNTTAGVRYDTAGRDLHAAVGPFPRGFVAKDVVPAPGGGVTVAGWVSFMRSGGNTSKTLLVRLGADGRPNPSFGTGGTVEFTDDVKSIAPGTMTTLADGRTALDLEVFDPTQWEGGFSSMVTLFGASGAIDTSFGDGGFVDLPGWSGIGPGMAVQNGTRLVVVTSTGYGDESDALVSAVPFDPADAGGGGPVGDGSGGGSDGGGSGSGGSTGGGHPGCGLAGGTYPNCGSTGGGSGGGGSNGGGAGGGDPTGGGPGGGGSPGGGTGEPAGAGGGPSGSATARPVTGYWMVTAAGNVFPFGSAQHLGDPAGRLGRARAVDLEPAPDGNGYWILDSTGEVYAYGSASRIGRVPSSTLAAGEETTSLSASPTGGGYWVFSSRGRAVPFGDAAFYGDMANVPLNGKVLGSVSTPSGRGYYMVAADGGIFTFGDAAFHGSTGNLRLNQPVMGMAPAADGSGYWLVAADGGVFAFGVPFSGSMGGTRLNKPITGMVPGGDGYLMVAADGGIFSFGTVPFFGSLGGQPPASPVVAAALRR